MWHLSYRWGSKAVETREWTLLQAVQIVRDLMGDAVASQARGAADDDQSHRLAQRWYPRGHARQTELNLSVPGQARQIHGHHGCLFIMQIKRVSAAAKHKRLRSIRMTSTIITIRTIVPIPIYIEVSFPGSARYRYSIRFLAPLRELGSIQLPADGTLKPRDAALALQACDRSHRMLRYNLDPEGRPARAARVRAAGTVTATVILKESIPPASEAGFMSTEVIYG